MPQLGVGYQVIQEELKPLPADHVGGQIYGFDSAIVNDVFDGMHPVVTDRVVRQVQFFKLNSW